jgi:hypothetical protein
MEYLVVQVSEFRVSEFRVSEFRVSGCQGSGFRVQVAQSMKSDGLKIFADVACLILLFPILNPEP